VSVSPRLGERALADAMAREDVEAYDIRVDLPATQRTVGEQRVATIGFASRQDLNRARTALEAISMDGLRMHFRPYRDPRTRQREPPIEEWRYPYVTHESNLSHPPSRHARDIVITGLDPRHFERSNVRELVESECGDGTVLSVQIAENSWNFAARAYVELDRHSTAIRAIEKIDGMIDRGYAITVNWDGRPAPPRRAPSPPHNGFTSRPFREFRLALGGILFFLSLRIRPAYRYIFAGQYGDS
jgi:hypothetical protein